MIRSSSPNNATHCPCGSAARPAVGRGENYGMCGKPPVAIRRWTRDDGYDDCELLPEEGVYGPACKLHANHDVVPLSEVLKAVADTGCWNLGFSPA